MLTIRSLFLATRPKTLIASLSPMLIGTAMAARDGHLSFWVFFFTLLTGLGIQVSTNFANDLYDYIKGADTSERKGPLRVTQSKLLTVAQVKMATLAIMGFTAICGSILILRGGGVIGLMIAFALLFAWGYTAGPFPLAYLGLAEIFILIFFGPVATGFTYYLQTLKFSLESFLLGLSPGFISCSLCIINNLRDIEEDRKANKKTLIARFGKYFGKLEYAIMLILAFIAPLFFTKKQPTMALTLLSLPLVYLLVAEVWKNADTTFYNPLLGKTGKLLYLFTFTCSLGLLL